MGEPSLYERLGGAYAISAVVDSFSDQLVEKGTIEEQNSNIVFSTRTGTPIGHRNAKRGFAAVAKKAKLDSIGFHVLRHGFASYLIVDPRLDPVQVSKQLGHTRPSITLDRYSHLFDQARHAADIRDRMAASAFGHVLEARS
jgi:integrase